jgi:hypothetical protein
VSHLLGNNIQILGAILALEWGDQWFWVPWPPWPKARYPWIENDRVPSTDFKNSCKNKPAHIYDLDTVGVIRKVPQRGTKPWGLILLWVNSLLRASLLIHCVSEVVLKVGCTFGDTYSHVSKFERIFGFKKGNAHGTCFSWILDRPMQGYGWTLMTYGHGWLESRWKIT